MKLKSLLLCLVLICSILFTSCSRSEGEDVPSGMMRVSNEYVDFDFFVPTDWIAGENDACINAKKSDSVLANISVMCARVGDDITNAEQYWEKYKADFESAYTDFEIVSDEACLLDGHEAHKYVYTGVFSDVSAKYMQTVCVRGGVVYLITYTADPEKYDEYTEDIQSMIDNFVFKG